VVVIVILGRRIERKEEDMEGWTGIGIDCSDVRGFHGMVIEGIKDQSEKSAQRYRPCYMKVLTALLHF
jgi:hypothetical protein